MSATSDVREMLRARYSAVSPGNGPRYVLAPEVRNRAGFSATRSADLIVMDTWESGPVRLIGHEIKVSRSDWLRELKDPSKAAAFIPYMAEWWLVVSDRKIVRDGELPDGWGLLAPAGSVLRVVNKARLNREPLTPPMGMVAAMMRSVQAVGRREVDMANKPKPHTVESMPRMITLDNPPDDQRFPYGEIQRPRHDLRRIS